MTGTAWESRGELWAIYNRAVVRIPTNKPCIRIHLPLRFFDTMEQKWDAAIRRIVEINETGAPVLVGTRSVLASQEVSKRLAAAGKVHRVLNAVHHAEIISIFPEFERPIRLFDTHQIPYVIEQGEKAMLEHLPYVKRLLELES